MAKKRSEIVGQWFLLPRHLMESIQPYRNELIRLAVGLSALVAGTCACLGYQAVRRFTLDSVKENALLEVQQGVDDVDRWLAILKDRVETLARTPELSTVDWSTVEPYLRQELVQQSSFFKFELIDPQGTLLGNTSVGLANRDLSDRLYFQQAIAGRTNLSDVIVSRTTGILQVNVATPIWIPPISTLPAEDPSFRDRDRELIEGVSAEVNDNDPIGIFLGSVKIDRIEQVVGQLHYGDGSYGFVLNSDGEVMIHPRKAWVPSGDPPLSRLLASTDGNLATIADHIVERRRGIEKIRFARNEYYIAYLPLEEVDWSIGLVIERSAIEGQLRNLDAIAIVLALITSGFIFALLRLHLLEKEHLRKSKNDAEAIARAASAANNSKSYFLSKITHELLTPLNGILGYAQILQLDSTLNKQQLKGLDIINRNGNHLLHLIDEILDYSRVESHRMELDSTAVILNDLIESVTEIMRLQASQKGIEYRLHLDEDLPKIISTDEHRLRQVLLNLLGNAIKYTSAGSVLLNVQALDYDNSTVKLRFEVSDTGIGIHSHDLTSIFERFEQVNPTHSSREGIGLGLAITRNIIKMMGGVLRVESEFGVGSKFWFDASYEMVESSNTHTSVVDKDVLDNFRTIVLVGDKQDISLLLHNKYEVLGYEVLSVEYGQNTLDEVLGSLPDMVIVSLENSLEFTTDHCIQLFRLFEQEGIPAIAISTRNLANKARNPLDNLCDARLMPFMTSSFIEIIESYINIDVQQRELRQASSNPSLLTQDYKAIQQQLIPTYKASIIAPPRSELLVLYEIAQFGNMKAIWDYSDKIEQSNPLYRPFCQRLKSLSEDFEDELIVAFIEDYMS